MAETTLNEFALENLYVTGTAAINSLSVSESLVIGSDLVIVSQADESSGQLTTSLNTLNSPLELQSSASQPLLLMAGLVTIDTQGNVDIAGSLAVQHNLSVGGTLSAKSLTLSADSENLTGFGKLLSFVNSLGDEVASISATGSARFKDVTAEVFAVKNDPTATQSASLAGIVFETNATAGTARITSGNKELIIRNPKISADSLIFVTPTSSTASVLYIKEQLDGEILVGFDNPVVNDVSFNWWIVGVTD